MGDEVGVTPCAEEQKIGNEMRHGVEKVGHDVLAIKPNED